MGSVIGAGLAGAQSPDLPPPVLVGGDVTAVPERLRRYIGGSFTQTVLIVTPPSPATANTVETLKTTVIPTAAGSVQFKDGSTPLGDPVAVTNGTASIKLILPSGTHSSIAEFIPTDPVVSTRSTLNPVSYVVKAAVTSTTLTVAPNPAFQGTVFLIARVASSARPGPSSSPMALPHWVHPPTRDR